MKKPDSAQALVQRVLDTATKDCDSPDVRDRAYIYWRLLSTDPAAAKVCNAKASSFCSLIHVYTVVCHSRPSSTYFSSTINYIPGTIRRTDWRNFDTC